MVKCFGLQATFLFVNCNFIGTSFFTEANTFKPLLSTYGSPGCAVDNSMALISVSEVRIGMPSGVPDPVLCAFSCGRFQSCTSFNYRRSRNAANDGGQCELYTVSPRNCTIDEFCQHYQVSMSHVSAHYVRTLDYVCG
jgi:hypothetical protein